MLPTERFEMGRRSNELFIYGDAHCVTNVLCRDALKWTHPPVCCEMPFLNNYFCYCQYIVLFTKHGQRHRQHYTYDVAVPVPVPVPVPIPIPVPVPAPVPIPIPVPVPVPYSLFVLCPELHFARMHTKCLPSCPHHTKVERAGCKWIC
jgi:hypothetical protein